MTTDRADTRPYRQVARARAQDERRWRILRAAWDLFAHSRYDEITVADIAERAGVSERTAYRLIGPKERLLESWEGDAVADRHAWERGEDVSRPWALRIGWQRWLDEDHNPLRQGHIEDFIGGTMRFHEEWGDVLMNLRRQTDQVPQFAEFLDYSRRRHRDNVDHLLGDLMRDVPNEIRLRRFEGLYAISDFPMWHTLRREAGMSVESTKELLLDLIRCLVAGEGN